MSTKLETAKQYMNAFATLDGDTFRKVKTNDCLHHFAPASLGIREPKGNDDFAAHMIMLQGLLKGFPVHIQQLWEGEKNVTIWATSQAQFRERAMDTGISPEAWNFRGEYIFILEFNEHGDQITNVVEFLDSKATEELRRLMDRARRNLGLTEHHI